MGLIRLCCESIAFTVAKASGLNKHPIYSGPREHCSFNSSLGGIVGPCSESSHPFYSPSGEAIGVAVQKDQTKPK